MKIGLYGGTFDPVHWGHLLLAEACREQFHLDQVWFMPAAVPPHKQGMSISAAEHRVNMLRLATGGAREFLVSTLELERSGPSYTVETLEEVRQLQPNDQWYLLLGEDSLADFPTWKEPARIMELAELLVVGRDRPVERGEGAPESQGKAASGQQSRHASLYLQQMAAAGWEVSRIHWVEMPRVELSASQLRERVAAGRGIRFRVPAAVEAYILGHQLYAHAAPLPGSAKSKNV